MAMPNPQSVLAETRAWLRHAVIGLNLCPFARGVEARGGVRFVVSGASDEPALLTELCTELQRLADCDADEVETTLIVLPGVLGSFADFNDFQDVADAALAELGLDGVLQVASFHPGFQFAGTEPDDISNATNRSPYPTLHLLREASIERALEGVPDPASIFEANIATLDALGANGWAALQARCRAEALAAPMPTPAANGPAAA